MPGLTLLSLGLSLAVLWGTLGSGHSERHSLTYIYTALSKHLENPGIHDFTAMGRLDAHMIDYFDSDNRKKVPKQPWMKERLTEDYWAKGTDSRKSKQQWFKVNLDILKERMNQTDEEVHVLQWMHGCEADLLPDGELSFQRGIDMYSYDGNSFLYFDDYHAVWVAAADEAKLTKRKWDEVQVLKDYTKGYLEKECIDWLRKFMDYGKEQLLHKAPPEVYLFASPARHKENVFLTCMATGFYPPDIILTLTRDGRPLGEPDGVTTTGLRPNNDDTFQRRDRIEILRSDRGLFACEVVHVATYINKTVVWDGKLPDDEEEGGLPLGPVLGALGVLMTLVACIAVGIVFTKQKKQKPQVLFEEYASLDILDQKKVPLTNGSQDKGSDDNIYKTSDSDSVKSSDSGNGSSDSRGSSDSSDSRGSDQPLLSSSEESGGSVESV